MRGVIKLRKTVIPLIEYVNIKRVPVIVTRRCDDVRPRRLAGNYANRRKIAERS